MKKYVFLLLGLVFLWGCQFLDKNADTTVDALSIPFSDDGERWGIVSIDGVKIVENEWEQPSSISREGIVRVKNKDGKYEFYTATSNPQKIGSDYRNASLFSEGLAAVVIEQGFIHYIDLSGNIKFELPDDGKGSPVQKAGLFSESLARFQNSENLWGFIDMMGKVVIKPTYDYVYNFSEGLALVEKYNETINETSRGFINKEGVVVIPLEDRYTELLPFQDGLSACTDKEAKNQWGFIDKQGNRVVEINNRRVRVGAFKDDAAPFFDGEYYGLINKTGEIIVNPKYDALMALYWNDRGPFTSSSNLIGFINSNRKVVIKPQFEEVMPFFASTTIVRDKYYYFIDKDGNDVAKDVYLRYVPIKDITKEYLTYKNKLVHSLNINLKIISDAFIHSLNDESVNGLSFNSSVCDVISLYKVAKSDLPRNTYQRRMSFQTAVAGNLLCDIHVEFIDPTQIEVTSYNELKPNCESKLQIIKYELNVNSFEDSDISRLAELIEKKILNAGYVFNQDLTQQSWIENLKVFQNNNAIIEFVPNPDSFYIVVDYSDFYNL